MQQIQLADAKNRLSEIAKQAQQGESFELTVRGTAVAHIIPIPYAKGKAGFYERTLAMMSRPDQPAFNIRDALRQGRK